MNIRRLSIRLFFTMLACLIPCAAPAAAEEDRWMAEYQAYGRTIRVDAEITVPAKESFSFLAVEPMNELSDGEVEKYSTAFAALDLEQHNRELNFTSRKNLIYIQYNDHASHPDLSDAEKVTTPNRPLYVYDGDKAYAEDNDLTVNEAEELIRENIRKIFPDADFRIRDIILNDRTKYRKSGKKITDKGYYEINCIQVFDGIPLSASVHRAYRSIRDKRDIVTAGYGTAYANVTDRNDFEASYTLWDKAAELKTPDRLLSFEEIRPKIEAYILGGNIRTIYHVCLGYAQYNLPEESPYESVLAPAWVFQTGWMDDPAEEAGPGKTVNGTDYAAGCSYLPVIINAVTGDITDPLDESEGRMLLPEGCMEWIQ